MTRWSATDKRKGMRRIASWPLCLVVILLFGGIVHAQSRLSIRAASATPVDGWQKMQVEHSDRFVWVAPTAAITESDIEKAQPDVRADGDTLSSQMPV